MTTNVVRLADKLLETGRKVENDNKKFREMLDNVNSEIDDMAARVNRSSRTDRDHIANQDWLQLIKSEMSHLTKRFDQSDDLKTLFSTLEIRILPFNFILSTISFRELHETSYLEFSQHRYPIINIERHVNALSLVKEENTSFSHDFEKWLRGVSETHEVVTSFLNEIMGFITTIVNNGWTVYEFTTHDPINATIHLMKDNQTIKVDVDLSTITWRN
jgi:ribosomal protein S17E|tara:strand:- start:6689 stop:7339 length:651 start_codon:yes stop_codon:yes gene_type:complete